ncbi:MAG: type II toxin-antitoxin system YoeB family toxin [Dermatophilaceae bacterium]
MLLVWDENAWADYLWRQAQDRRVLTRITLLLNDIRRDGVNASSGPGLAGRSDGALSVESFQDPGPDQHRRRQVS